jgi:hypothetical protein
LDLSVNEFVGRKVKSQVLECDLLVETIDRDGLGALEQADLHIAALKHPCSLPAMEDFESEDLLVPVGRSLKVLDTDREVVDIV